MTIDSTWDNLSKGSRLGKAFLTAMWLCNAVFALANVFFWSSLAVVLADPISWSTWSSMGGSARQPELLEYPFVVLWALPLAGSAIAALYSFLGFGRMARVAAMFPLALFAFTVGWWTIFRDTL